MNNKKPIKRQFLLLISIFLFCLLAGCNDSSSDSDSTKSADIETTWYRDADGDGFGDPSAPLTQASQPDGYVADSRDCADYDADIFPGASETCDGKDNNCDGNVDENACGPDLQTISGHITNVNEAQAYIKDDSYLQLVAYPADGQPVFTTDAQGRRVYTSDLAAVDIPANGDFVFETFGLLSGDYVIAAQDLASYGPDSGQAPLLADMQNNLLIFTVPVNADAAFKLDLGNLRLPVPAPVVSLQSELEIPTGVCATNGDYEDKIRVTWNASSGATSYEVYRADSFVGQQVKIATTSALFYDDSSVPCEEDYYYWVKAVNASTSSGLFYNDNGFIRCPLPDPLPVVADDAADEDETVAPESEDPPADPVEKPVSLDTPTGTAASDGTYPDKIRITWDPVPLATSYDVYRTKDDCCGLKVKIGTSNDTVYDDDDNLSAGDYYYWIKANNASGTSEFSFPDGGHIMTRPFAPTGVQASDGTYYSKVRVTWNKPPSQSFIYNGPCCPPISNKVPETTSYEIYRARFVGDTKTMIGTTKALEFYDTDLECSGCSIPEGYVYWVKAVNSAGKSEFSNDDSGYVYRTLCDPVPTASDGKNNCVWITWELFNCGLCSIDKKVKKYDIYRADSENGEKIKICSVDHPCTKFRDTTTTCPRIYYYWVKAIDANGYTSCVFGDYDTGYCSDE